jgi:hypothetical protein
MSDSDFQLHQRRTEHLELTGKFEISQSSFLRREAKPLPKLTNLLDLVDVIGLVGMFAVAIIGLNALSW